MNTLLELLSLRKFAAKTLTFLIIATGVFIAIGLPMAEKPRYDMMSGNITTSYPGATALDIESNITSKIEKELLLKVSVIFIPQTFVIPSF
ncbi:efflux RND transporter permease subunit [Endozoicomonas acroporae]|uniref:efflux RND transporter permease subunit n=1 Tax=Endozoicomonas acroporae TaxID=1701104 RepID=UPI0019D5EA74|nr:efflux RND transporter permease subunit [Endozoicomonas acroporae]